MTTLRLPHGDAHAGYAASASIVRDGWHLLALRGGRAGARWRATVRITPESGDAPLQAVLGWAVPGSGARLGVVFLRAGPCAVAVDLHGGGAPEALTLDIRPLRPRMAALGVVLQQPGTFHRAFRAGSGPLRLRFRKALALAALHGPTLRGNYRDWLELYDPRPASDASGAPPVQALVFAAADGPALQATLASLDAQTHKLAATTVLRPGDPLRAEAPLALLLQAGEVLAADALAGLLAALPRGAPALALADEDALGKDGGRRDPWFKPEPSLLFMCSGLLSRGAWLVSTSLLDGAAEAWAECARLHAFFRLHAAGDVERARRVPFLFTHRRWDAEAAPPTALAATLDANLRRLGIAASAAPGFPVRLQWRRSALNDRRVAVVVPSRLRGDTQLRCMADVLERTAHRNFEMLVVVTQEGGLDAAQQEAARRLERSGRARVAVLRRQGFNYSAANNFGARETEGELICFLNDDVSTLDGDWLDMLVARMSVAEAGIVGAKLYYPNLATQHGGVLMGMGGLADHMHRLLPRGEPGYMWRGVLDQELSAVTGACLLVRRAVHEALGGMNETLPTAFNDVDYCLRAREAGWSVVMAAPVELLHHETLSFGSHYAGAPERERADVRRMQERWRAVCAADPFHNPNLSLSSQSEWRFAFPPRRPYRGAGS